MLKRILLFAPLCLLLTADAQARHRHRYLHTDYMGCGYAARLGGPCGCIAAKLFGLGDRRDLWAVSAWYRFPRSGPAVGTAMIWPGRHVAKVIGVDGSRITVHDTYGVRIVHSTGVFVRPHG